MLTEKAEQIIKTRQISGLEIFPDGRKKLKKRINDLDEWMERREGWLKRGVE